jgi:hypothetical protein
VPRREKRTVQKTARWLVKKIAEPTDPMKAKKKGLPKAHKMAHSLAYWRETKIESCLVVPAARRKRFVERSNACRNPIFFRRESHVRSNQT